MRVLFACFAFFCALTVSAQKKNIQPSQLPENALTFIETNFTSVALHHCMKFTEGDNVRFKAVLADDTEIDFTEDGKWKEVDGKVHSVQPTFLGQTIIEYIKKNAPGQRLLKATNQGKTIDVTLVNGQKFTFDTSGKFIR
ncbi:PepSY-like domain-containing protein [Flavobacterium sp. MAH-1]|uniref:PepSY-like domain-containing protein n=1 Tax=Flavobacterium agri TaxID=2743471 RepID=A0A7Y9C6G4_9FLAO|nr:PepSY-like domain-containing protein [Flavobacterium agri]NUY82036.1 PepSY-like domain-containing protein [Flavobacterium agri]NYA72060.1 PepSY-like domain-containing protein [Flavobacterium agri]